MFTDVEEQEELGTHLKLNLKKKLYDLKKCKMTFVQRTWNLYLASNLFYSHES